MTLDELSHRGVRRSPPGMNRELFGITGDRRAFERYRSPDEFHRIVSGDAITVGIRDDGVQIKGRSSAYEAENGCAAIWGEVITPPAVEQPPAEWLYRRTESIGDDVFTRLNGSYVAVVDVDGELSIVPDHIRSRECFYADVNGNRIFGTDAAAVASVMGDPALDPVAMNQLLYFGVVFEDRTLLDELSRIRFDVAHSRSDARPLGRIRYRPIHRSEEEHASELATRLRLAVNRRIEYPPPKGILSSAGFDSRMILATVPDLDVSYTLGSPSMPEVVTARKLANQYGVDHQVLPITPEYLKTTPDIVQYTNGIRESVHIHHRGNEAEMDARTIYHGLLLDTVLRDIYLPRKRIEAFGHALPLPGLVSDPDTFAYMQERLGIFEGGGPLIADHPDYDNISEREFLDRTLSTVIEDCREATDSIHNAMSLLGLRVTQALPFQTHLADNHFESLVAADTGLIDWHLTTPPDHRNSRTYQRAIEQIDDQMLFHRPPDRPHRSHTLNQIEGYLRRRIPYVPEAGTPWPDRDAMYEEQHLDAKLFPDAPQVHHLPPRVKLRLNDALVWLESATGRRYHPDDFMRIK